MQIEPKLKRLLSDQYWRLNNLYFIIDKQGKKVLFKMNWAQEYLYRNFHNYSIILKARQIGFSTFFQILALDLCLFNENYNAGLICARLDDAKSVFRNKVKFSYNNLHPVIRQMVPVETDSAGELSFSNNSCLSVGTSYRGSTPMFLHVSELAKISAKFPERADEIQSGAFNAVPKDGILLIESTAEGNSGLFHDLCMSSLKKHLSGDELFDMDFKFFFFPWHEHPEYVSDSKVVLTDEEEEYFDNLELKLGKKITEGQRAFYVLKWRLSGDKIWREFPSTPEESFRVSIEGSYYNKLMLRARIEKRIGKVPFEKNLPVNTAWDLGMDDHTVIWFFQIYRGSKLEVRLIDYYENNEEGLTHYVNVVKDKGRRLKYKYGRHFFPHDVKVKEMNTGTKRIDFLKSLGLKAIPLPKSNNLADDIETVRQTLPFCWFNESSTKRGVECLENYKKKRNRTTGEFSESPLKDGNDHGADAFRMLCMSLGKLKQTRAIMIY